MLMTVHTFRHSLQCFVRFYLPIGVGSVHVAPTVDSSIATVEDERAARAADPSVSSPSLCQINSQRCRSAAGLGRTPNGSHACGSLLGAQRPRSRPLFSPSTHTRSPASKRNRGLRRKNRADESRARPGCGLGNGVSGGRKIRGRPRARGTVPATKTEAARNHSS